MKMLNTLIGILLLIVGGIFAFLLATDLPKKGELKLFRTLLFSIIICFTIGFGLHFMLLGFWI